MMRFIHGILLCLLVVLPCVGESLRLATYNLKNYLSMDRRVDSTWRLQYPKPEVEKRSVREVIKQVAPDILALQEIGSLPYLEELRSDLAAEGLYYPYVVHMVGEDAERHLGLLSQIQPLAVHKHVDMSFKYFDKRLPVRRGMLELVFGDPVNDVHYKLFVVHLKSRFTENKADPDSELRRVREAEACRNRVIQRTFDADVAHFIIAGDFNDHPASASLRRFYHRGPINIASKLRAEDSRGELWTHYYAKESLYSSVDGLLFSEAFLSSWVVGKGCIVDNLSSLKGSDHRMVYVDVEF
jgi:endonuclease/exonuclease/phosphatase family metal-dependent hydrolase